MVKPSLRNHGLNVARADEIRRAGLLTETITDAIAASKCVVADLTMARPNSYYEFGYAHALERLSLVIAKEGTERHFNVYTHRWNY